MYTLDLEKSEEPEIKLPTPIGSQKKQGNSRKTSTSASLIKPTKDFDCIDHSTKDFDCVDHNKLWKIFQKIGLPDHLTCLLQNLYAAQEATFRTGHEMTNWFKTEK